jgi:thymidylate kinase
MRALSDLSVGYVPCYADHVGGGRFLPRAVPRSLAEDNAALQMLLAVESARTACARSQRHDVVLLDRSVHTLLAHRYALEGITTLTLLSPARRLLTGSAIPLWPNLVLYLDLPQEAISDRNNGKFGEGNVFIDPQYSAGVRSYFESLADSAQSSPVWMNASLDPAGLQNIAEMQIRSLLDRENHAAH